MNIKLIRYLSVTLILLAFSAMVIAKGTGERKNPTLNKSQGAPVYTKININNVSTWIKNDGETDINQNGNSGLVFPKGSNKPAFFQSGFLWGGKVDGQVRVGGSVYRQGTVPGRILPSGVAANPDDPDVRIYRVRRDYVDGDLSAELADGDGASIEAIRAQYAKDWTEWPASQGAPFEDVNGNGTYQPSVDIPGVPGADQTVWFVANDLDAAQTDFMYGSLPMGIEEQVTVWGYKATGALGNMIFRKFLIINKSPQQKAFTDMYVAMWSDPDLGDAGDDYVGTDTVLSLGYVYNASASDATYNPLPPPAGGFDFFQGPLVPGEAGDVGIFKGKYVEGKKNLPMTAFVFFINPDAVYSDPTQGNYERGTLGWWNLFQGRISSSGQPFTDPHTGQATMKTLAGDPITGLGWIDGQLHPPADRRMTLVSGTFNMAYGDTQEIVVAQILAGATPGVDRLGAVQLLKFYDLQAQLAYDNFFNVPTAPPAPVVSASAYDREVILTWGNDAAKVTATETYSKGGFDFEGYVVYQLPNANAVVSEGKRLATYDLLNGVLKVSDLEFDATSGVVQSKVVQFGSDSGIKRSISITTDAFKGGLPLNNGTRYYFAVTSYAYNPDPNAVPRQLENAITIITVVPQGPAPGVRYPLTAGTEVPFSLSAGKTDGTVVGTVIDPAKLSGATYRVTFKDDPDHPGSVLWTLARGTTILQADQANLSGDDNYLIFDGLQIKVAGPPPGVKPDDLFSTDDQSKWGWNWTAGTRRLTWAGGDGFHLEGFNGALGWTSPRAIFRDGQMVVQAHEVKNLEIRFAKVDFTGDFNPPIDPTDPNVSYGYRYMRGATGAPAKPEFAPYIINKVGNYSFQAFEKNVPLSVWNIENPAQPKRLAVGFLENNVAAGLVDGKYWPGSNANIPDNVSAAGSTREWLFIFDEAYSETANPVNQAALISTTPQDPHRIMYTATWNRRGSVAFSPGGTGADVLKIFSNKVLTKDNVFTLVAPSVVTDLELAKEDVEEINVFPNPYYGVNPQELNKYQRFVTFTHLPNKATIRIFNLAGQLVRTMDKDNADQFFRWDLMNQDNLPVASGLYIVHVDMPDLGKVKIIKAAIIQEKQVLDRF
jgi:hypothetical protein